MTNRGFEIEKAEGLAGRFIAGYEKSCKEDDVNLGIDGYDCEGAAWQVKWCGHASDKPTQGYSTCNSTSQRKLTKNVDWILLVVPVVEAYVPRYKLSHEWAAVYKVNANAAVRRKLFKYATTNIKNAYLDKTKRLILDRMVKDGKAIMLDIVKNADV